ncbi:hypothetical protein QGM61_01650 [Pseudohongiella sp. SYSU M77423]|uniref:hypothetical protein n=1 Tax=Pseudohongiella sp. SYSU M77423 TaxID=3042312 RepID=UPI000C980FCF|nr:hypothetical protein [Pseudohongiella sp. SYSU M77423]MAO40002.1 hypothetical protein [Pseudohongiella sp.]MDH7942511.1 hypothetical protein [Pseudohongiella sp. SYSU M77423]HBX38313.1 hypothetical protein [Pseudohongiella sp.]|tara:strand:+ start:10277 stop:11131 length:855 start_codon:yes stop_codon:yes gene_type:complete
MTFQFPTLPDYAFSWRSLQVEPIPFSGERITVGLVLKGHDQALIAARLVPSSRLKRIYGFEMGARIADALSLCVDGADKFYSRQPLTGDWLPPLEGFYLGDLQSSLAENIEDALIVASKSSSSISLAMSLENSEEPARPERSAPEDWRKSIYDAVTGRRGELAEFFERSVTIRGYGLPMKFGFIAGNYAAQFDAVYGEKGIQQALIRAQSKLWQLDRLRDESQLFPLETCELVLKAPAQEAGAESSVFSDFVEELKFEASRRDLAVFATDSAIVAAEHVIERAA